MPTTLTDTPPRTAQPATPNVVVWTKGRLAFKMQGMKKAKQFDALFSDAAPGVALHEGQFIDTVRDADKANLEIQLGWRPMIIATGLAIGPTIHNMTAASKYAVRIAALHDWIGGGERSTLCDATIMRAWWEVSGKPMPDTVRDAIEKVERTHAAAVPA